MEDNAKKIKRVKFFINLTAFILFAIVLSIILFIEGVYNFFHGIN